MTEKPTPKWINEKLLGDTRIELQVVQDLINDKKEEISKLLNEKLTFPEFWAGFLKIMVKLYSRKEEFLQNKVSINNGSINRRGFLEMIKNTAIAAAGGSFMGASVGIVNNGIEEDKIRRKNPSISQEELLREASQYATNILTAAGVGAGIATSGSLLISALELRQEKKYEDLKNPKNLEDKMTNIYGFRETIDLMIKMAKSGLSSLDFEQIIRLGIELHFLEMRLQKLSGDRSKDN